LAARNDPRSRGGDWEHHARRLLERAGLATLDCNFHVRGGELDLVMRDADTTVFVEVRQRTNASRGRALETIGPVKVRRIRRAATLWLVQNRLTESACRFDIVCIDGSGRDAQTQWIKSAF